MTPALDPTKLVLAPAARDRAIKASICFKRRTIRIVHLAATAMGGALILWGSWSRTALLTPVDPNFRAFMIGLGVFLGVLAAEAEREAWVLGVGIGRGPPPNAFRAVLTLAFLVIWSGVGGNFVAAELWEWQAFHGFQGTAIDRSFEVVGRHSSRFGTFLELEDASGGPQISIHCSSEMYRSVSTGEHLVLEVQSGRHGVRRVSLPPLRDLRRS